MRKGETPAPSLEPASTLNPLLSVQARRRPPGTPSINQVAWTCDDRRVSGQRLSAGLGTPWPGTYR